MEENSSEKILITGKSSYIGTELIKWLTKYPKRYEVDEIDVRSESWKLIDFSKYDTIVHLAGIVHVKETKKNRKLYFSVNRDLTIALANKAKLESVKQFIFLSTMNVYGMEKGKITERTIPKPNTSYGISKLEAENKIRETQSEDFTVTILRPPMVYGKNCRGNYSLFAKVARRTLIFPDISNKRSMIYIDNLSEAIRQVIDRKLSGIFFPQNVDYVNTSDMVRLIAKEQGHEVRFTKVFNCILQILNFKLINKIFGSLIYDKKLPTPNQKYISFENSISRTESKCEKNRDTI